MNDGKDAPCKRSPLVNLKNLLPGTYSLHLPENLFEHIVFEKSRTLLDISSIQQEESRCMWVFGLVTKVFLGLGKTLH